MTEPTATPRTGRDLPVAMAVGAGLLLLLAAALAGPPWVLAVLVLVLLVTALVETSGIMAASGRPVALDVLIVVAIAAIAGAAVAGERGLLAALVLLPIAALAREVVRRDRSAPVDQLGRTVLLGVWVIGLGAHAVLLRGGPAGAAGVIAVVLVVAVADTAAYAVGSVLGRHRLAPQLSPNKTVEGLLGAVIAATGVGAVALPALGVVAGPLTGAVLATAVAVAAALGDLAESMVKRDLGVKDLGRALPGHGGMLDRVDGILLGLPVGHHLLGILA